MNFIGIQKKKSNFVGLRNVSTVSRLQRAREKNVLKSCVIKILHYQQMSLKINTGFTVYIDIM